MESNQQDFSRIKKAFKWRRCLKIFICVCFANTIFAGIVLYSYYFSADCLWNEGAFVRNYICTKGTLTGDSISVIVLDLSIKYQIQDEYDKYLSNAHLSQLDRTDTDRLFADKYKKRAIDSVQLDESITLNDYSISPDTGVSYSESIVFGILSVFVGIVILNHSSTFSKDTTPQRPPNRRRRNTSPIPPRFGERLLLLILTKEERVNIPGDLEEECREIAVKHGARYARLWYYKQVVASAWPMICKVVRWGLLAWLGAWIRRII